MERTRMERGLVYRGKFVFALLAVALIGRPASAQLFSYASDVERADEAASGDLTAALGVPDYEYLTDSFVVDVAAVFAFPAPIDDVTGDDLLVHVFVQADESDTTFVRVEARAAPADPFVEVGTIDTSDARVPSRFNLFSDFDHVHVFGIDFDGLARKVSEVRLTVLSGTPLMLDAIEAVHPALRSPASAVEMRLFRLRDDESKRFSLRFKNLGPFVDGEAMTGFIVAHATGAFIDQTDKPVQGVDGAFEATPETTAGPDNGDHTQSTEYVWTGTGVGLEPGEVASHGGNLTIDTDLPDLEFLENLTFEINFSSGVMLTVTGAEMLTSGTLGQLYSLYQNPPSPPSINGPRPAYYFELFDGPAVAEDICTDCGPIDNTPPGGNDNENDNTDGGNPPGSPATCGAGAAASLTLMVGFAPFLRSTARRRCSHAR